MGFFFLSFPGSPSYPQLWELGNVFSIPNNPELELSGNGRRGVLALKAPGAIPGHASAIPSPVVSLPGLHRLTSEASEV